MLFQTLAGKFKGSENKANVVRGQTNQNFSVSPQQSQEVITRKGRSYELRERRVLFFCFSSPELKRADQSRELVMLTVLISDTPLPVHLPPAGPGDEPDLEGFIVPIRLWEHSRPRKPKKPETFFQVFLVFLHICGS